MTTDLSPHERDAESIRRLRAALDRLVAGAANDGSRPGIEVDAVSGADGGGESTDGDGLPARSYGPGRRHTVPLFSAAAALCLLALIAGVAVWARRDGQHDLATTGREAPASTSTVPGLNVSPPRVELDLEGATLVREETSTASDDAVTTWARTDGSAFLSLTVKLDFADYAESVGLTGEVPATGIPADEGTASFAARTSLDGHPTVDLLWSRPNGDLWMLVAHWQPSDTRSQSELRGELESWALAIDMGDAGFELADPAMRVALAQSAGDRGARFQAWSVDGHEVKIFAIQPSGSGLRNLLGVAGWATPRRVGGRDGWIVRHPAGTTLAVATDVDDGTWATVTFPKALTAQTDSIAAALVLE